MLTRDAESVGIQGIVSSLGSTCKTHKDSGSQCLRPLHKSTRNPLNLAMRFLRYFMREFLQDKAHILKNSRQLKKKLDTLNVLFSDLLVKIDVKDFFLSGRASTLADICSIVFPNEIRQECKALLLFLLENQFVMDNESGAVRRCIRGSGMGLCFSGEIADLVFYRLAETHFLESHRRQVVSYDRFNDDIFTIFRGSVEDCKLWFCQFGNVVGHVFKL